MELFLVCTVAVVLFIYLLGLIFNPAIEMVCKNCGFIGPVRKTTRGNLLIEIILWLLLIIPGICYSIWRLISKRRICPKCGSINLIPLDSPLGAELAKELERLKHK